MSRPRAMGHPSSSTAKTPAASTARTATPVARSTVAR